MYSSRKTFHWHNKRYVIAWSIDSFAVDRMPGDQTLDDFDALAVLQIFARHEPEQFDWLVRTFAQSDPRAGEWLRSARWASSELFQGGRFRRYGVELRVFVRDKKKQSEPLHAPPKPETTEQDRLASLQEEDVCLSWIEITLRRSDGLTVSGASYQIQLSNGWTQRGRSNSDGQCRFDQLPAGVCKFQVLARGWTTSKSASHGPE